MRTDLKSGLIKTVAGTGESGWTSDGAEALAACLNEPKGLTLDTEGNLFIADSENHIVRKIDKKTGRIRTVAGRIQSAESGATPVSPVPVDQRGDDDPFAESGTVHPHAFSQQTDLSGTVRYVVTGTTPAKRFSGDGGPANQALLNFPTAVVVDRVGHLYIADQNNNRVRVVDVSTGVICTVAGTGTAAYNGDGVAATETGLAGPSGLALASDGTLFIADSFNGRVRAVNPVTGIIRTVVGDGGEYRFHGLDEPPGTSPRGHRESRWMKREICTSRIRTTIWCGDGIEVPGVLSVLPGLVLHATEATRHRPSTQV